MSQHADILSYEITKGIKRDEHALSITENIAELLMVLEYDDSFTELVPHRRHVYHHAKGMMNQKDGLYGISHAQLDKFITELWCANQWLSNA